MHSNRIVIGALFLFVAAGIAFLTIAAHGQAVEFANFEGAQTNPIRLSVDGTRLFTVNTANASLSVFDVSTPTAPVLIGEIPVGLEPVSVNPRTNDEAWVVNQLSDSVSVVSVPRGIVTATINIPDEPMDVVFAGVNQAYVSVSRSNAVAVFDIATRGLRRWLPLFGGNPRALAASPNGAVVYAAFALSGNGTTLVSEFYAPPQPPPTNSSLPAAPQVGLIVSANDPAWSSVVTDRMPDNDVAVIRADEVPTVAGYYSRVGTVNLGLAVNPNNGDLFVANMEARNLTRFQPNLRGHWVDNRVTRVQISTGRITPFDLNPTVDYSTLPNPAARATALAQPTSIVFDPSGLFMYVAAFGTDRVARVDTGGRVLSFVEVGPPGGSGSNVDPRTKRGPRGLALSPDGRTLYVLNRISNTLSVIDTGTQSVVREMPVGTDATPPVIRVGRGFLYDAKLSGNGTGSCASCHVDGDMDHLAWDLGDPGGEMTSFRQGLQTVRFHPMKGPMTTQTLRGLAGLGPYHWRGDRANFQAFNPAFDALMGGSQLSTSDMFLFTAFVNTILFQPNPNQNLDGSLRTALGGGNPEVGRDVFLNFPGSQVPGTPITCSGCHTANPGAGTSRIILRAGAQPTKVPQLRNIYQKTLFNLFGVASIDGFGLSRDGHVSSFFDFFTPPLFDGYTTQQKTDLAAFVLSFDTGTAPAVGYSITLTSQRVATGRMQTLWTTLEQQAQARNIDLIVNGTVDGQVSRLSYDPSSDRYESDVPSSVSLSRAQVQMLIAEGDTLTVMGVPPPEGINQARDAGDLAATEAEEERAASRGH